MQYIVHWIYCLSDLTCEYIYINRIQGIAVSNTPVACDWRILGLFEQWAILSSVSGGKLRSVRLGSPVTCQPRLCGPIGVLVPQSGKPPPFHRQSHPGIVSN